MLKLIQLLRLSSVALALVFSALCHSSSPLEGSKQISLISKQGQRTVIGHVEFRPTPSGAAYKLVLDHDRFKDYFLSMKEMKCLEGPELWCHLAYPYQQPHTVTEDDLRWLAHDLLFMFKKKKDFGANFWNGIYYQLTIKEGVISGTAQAVDLNLLASPPDDLTEPPFTPGDLDEIDRQQRWLPDIEIH